MVKPEKEKLKKGKFADELFPAIPINRILNNKKCYFERKNDYYETVYLKHQKLLHDNKLLNYSNKSNNENKAAVSKQFFDTISNNKLLGITFNKEAYMSLNALKYIKKKEKNEYLNTEKNLWLRKENQKLASVRQKEENMQKDINYVTNLK